MILILKFENYWSKCVLFPSVPLFCIRAFCLFLSQLLSQYLFPCGCLSALLDYKHHEGKDHVFLVSCYIPNLKPVLGAKLGLETIGWVCIVTSYKLEQQACYEPWTMPGCGLRRRGVWSRASDEAWSLRAFCVEKFFSSIKEIVKTSDIDIRRRLKECSLASF